MSDIKRTWLSLVAGLCLMGAGTAANAETLTTGDDPTVLGGVTGIVGDPIALDKFEFSIAGPGSATLTDLDFGDEFEELKLVIAGPGGFLSTDSLSVALSAAGDYVAHILSMPDGSVGAWNFSVTSVAPVPVPAAALLFGSAITGLLAVGRRQRRSDVA